MVHRRWEAYTFFDNPGPIPFAHRGGAFYGPNVGIENSLVAFKNAIDLGFRYLETDVHATSDGVLVAFHDSTLDRVTDRTGMIADLPWSIVGEAKIAGKEPIPTLEDVLGSWPEIRVNIDVKEPKAISLLADVLRRTGAANRVCVSSFSGQRLRRAHVLLGPTVPIGLSPGRVVGPLFPLPRHIASAIVSDAVCVQLPSCYGRLRIVTPALVERAHDLGLHVQVWTIDDAGEMGDLLDMGVDGIMSDRPDVLRDVLIERGQWS